MPRKVPSSSGDVGKTVHNVNTTVSEKAKVGKSKPIEVKRQPQKHYFNQFSRAKTIISYLEDRAANQITAGSFDEDIDQSYAYSQLLTPAPSGADSKFQEEQRFRSTNEVVGAKKLMSSISSSSLLRREMISVQLSTPFMPNFAQLYHQTMQQLQEVCCFILSLSHNMDREKEKHRFLHALLAMRDISLRMVEYYASGRGRNCGQDWDDFTDAVAQIPNSLDFIDTEPFTRYSGLHFSYNPFACAFDLSGELSVSVPLPEAVLLKIVAEPKYDAVLLSYLPRELVVNEETFHRQLAANRALVSFCSAGPTQSKTTDDRASNQSKLAFLLFGSEKQQELHQNEDQVRALAKLCTQRRLWSAWRRAHFVRRTGAYLKMLHREHTLRHWWMNMIHYCDQIRGLRAVLASQERMQLAKGWRTWCAVVEW